MHRPLTIELADETLVEALRPHLQPFDVDTVEVEDHWELRIQLVERNPESRVVNALNAIDEWLLTAAVESVRVHLDGSSYTLHVPPRTARTRVG
ncbi:MAG: hypothetical protein QOJ43_1528 [Gaiellaceae bacterium]|jgi:hypothetical protein|nr:hypothetical protein [Gaiellaceae bacterium]